MTPVDFKRQFLNLEGAADKAFCAAFFFLPISKSLLFLALAIAFGLFIAGGGFHGAVSKWRALPWTMPALALALLPLLSLVAHPDLQDGLSNLDLAYYWLLAFVAFLASSRMAILPWIRAFLCGVFIAFCYAQAMSAGWEGLRTAPGSLANYILYSQMLAISIALLAVLYAHEADRRWKSLYLAGIVLFLVGMAFGNGRSGMLAVLVLFPFIFSNLFPNASRVKILLVCVVAVLALLMSPRVQTRIEAAVSDLRLMQNEMKETSLGYRIDMWTVASEVVRENPVFGAGPDGFRKAWRSTPRTGEALRFVEPHNAFFFYASSYGMIGLAALLWLYAALLRTGWRYRTSLPGGIAFSFAVVVVVGSLTNTMFMGSISHAWMMLFMGLQGALLHAASRAAPAAYEGRVATS